MPAKKLTFSAEIFIIGVNPYVSLPKEILQSLFKQAEKDKGPIAIKGKINGKTYKQTLVKYQGQWRLYLNGPMREASGIDVGDTANVEIAFDPKPRLEPMPPKLRQALLKNKKAMATYEKLAPSRKKEILRYLNSMKTQESLDRNIKKVMGRLLGKKVEGLVAFPPL